MKEKNVLKRTTNYLITKLHNVILDRNITDGIDVCDVILKDSEKKTSIICNTWDFAGQTIYYPTHRKKKKLFLFLYLF